MDAVIVSYNSARDLDVQLRHEPLRSAFSRVLVVDNQSSDASTAVARAAGVEVIERGVNDSLSAAMNEGMRRSTSEFVAFLNPDVLLDDPRVFRRLLESFDDLSVGLVAPTLILPDGSVQDSARTIPSPSQLVIRRLAGIQAGAIQAPSTRDVPWVVAACIVVRRSAYESIGGFDEKFQLYFEDVDFCVRMWSAGWRVRVDPTVTVRHEHQGSSRRSLFGWAMRRHLGSAARFFAHHPDLLMRSGRDRLTRAVVTR